MNDGYAGSGVKLNEYYRNYGKTENKTYEKNILRYDDTQKQLDAYEIYYGNYIPVVPNYLSNANISFFFKKPKIFAKKNQVFLDFFKIAYYL